MAIQSNDFGPVLLTGTDAARFIIHMNEDKPSPKAQAAIKRGRERLLWLKQVALSKA